MHEKVQLTFMKATKSLSVSDLYGGLKDVSALNKSAFDILKDLLGIVLEVCTAL